MCCQEVEDHRRRGRKEREREKERETEREGERKIVEQRALESKILNWLIFAKFGLLFFFIVMVPWRTSQQEALRIFKG